MNIGIIGQIVVAHGAEWEVLSEPAHPTYSNTVEFVWAKWLRAIPHGKSRHGSHRKHPTILFLPLKYRGATDTTGVKRG